MVDYDDLIDRTLQLLDDPGAAWVLYKLDGGIDHLLLDEVQDTSPDQWAIAGGLTAEFFAGEGTHDDEGCPRTIFAVGITSSRSIPSRGRSGGFPRLAAALPQARGGRAGAVA
ncbi:UvrD-helicase domain-containing protein [Komagataeibacter rhaeticus]|nr:UvrD-helicase domain-containing protein [Komagataeibacter rhaeticus]